MNSHKEHTPKTLRGMKVAVLKGGPGSEREVSLRSGEAVAKALQNIGCLVAEVDIHGKDFKIPDGTELAFNIIHGTFGEDGQIQALLEDRNIPYTGEGVKCSEVAFDKILTKEVLDRAGIPNAKWEIIHVNEKPSIGLPFVLKSPQQGSSVGVHIIREASQVDAAIADCLKYGPDIIVEAFFTGRELTVGILGDIALPIVEIKPKAGFYDYSNKYTKGNTDYLVPAPIDAETTARIQEVALASHRALGLEIYSRVDVLLSESGELCVLEINTIPGMTETSLLPKAAAEIGIGFGELCERIGLLSLHRFVKRK
ncbi:MAG: D-alanine--D-alanine ligase [Chthoniobacterales bacterium]